MKLAETARRPIKEVEKRCEVVTAIHSVLLLHLSKLS